jgi:hypothetical protein
MKRLLYLIGFLATFLLPYLSMAQEIEMADTMRSNGKIYVVVAVVAVVLAGMIVYISLLDKKVRQLEKEVDQKEK